MPTPLTGKDVTAIAITTGGSNLWIVQIECASGTLGSKVNTGAYTDGIEVDPAEAVILNISDLGGTEVLDFSYGDTVAFTIDTNDYTIQLDEAILANTDYYLDNNAVPFTDSGLITFIGIGGITEEKVDGTENIDGDSEFETSEGVGITEDVEEEQEVETSETVNLSESHYIEDEQETDEIIKATENITFYQGDADQWTKSNPTSNDNWVKNSSGDIV